MVRHRADSRKLQMLYVPESFAHGFQTLENDTEVIYQVSQFYAPQSEWGVRYNDPTLALSGLLMSKSLRTRITIGRITRRD